jgi:Carboxypeptidase regulatory-like domain/TonB dependent receptor
VRELDAGRAKTVKKLSLAVLSVVLWLFFAMSLLAQLNKGSIVGRVSDPTGAPVPGAQVNLQEVQTQAAEETKTDTSGYYSFSALNLGNYTVTVAAPLFKTSVQSGIALNAGQNIRLDVSLQLGQVTQLVSVTGAAPVIQTRDPTYSNTEDAKTLAQLPLQLGGAKRDATMYESTIPGYQGGAGFTSNFNGSIGTYNELLVDGAPAECNPAVLGGCLRGSFSTEAVAEFKVADATGADQGFTAGSVVTMVSKSGTNTLHGSGYEYLRNNALDARGFFDTNVPKDQQNEFGFTVGGPVYIPKVYDGRNKTFFYFNLGWFRYLYSVAGSAYTMPVDAYKNGDFSSLLGPQIGTDSLGRPVYQGEIYDPSTTRLDGKGGFVRDPFPGNAIPQGMFSPVSAKFQSYYPEPQNDALTNNWIAAGGSGSNPERYWSLKIDQSIGARHHLSGFYWNSSSTSNSPWALPPIFGVRTAGLTVSHPIHLGWTFTITPSTVNDAALAMDRTFTETFSNFADANNGAALIGQPNALGPCLPAVHIPGFFAGTQTELKCSQAEGDTNWRILDNLTHMAGKHLLKFGGNYIHWAGNFPVVTNGQFTFLPAQTGLPGQFLAQTGFSYASFLLGTVDDSAVQGGQYQAGRSYTFGFYGQDEYHVNQKLTLTLGLRYDAQPFPLQGHDQISQWLDTLPNPGAGGLPGALGYAGFGPGRLGYRRLAPSYWFGRNFAPRVGFAYRLTPNTSVRGSWGIYWGPVTQQMAGFDAVIQQGFFPTLTKTSLDGYSPAFNWTAGFPLGSANLFGNFDPAGANGSDTFYFGNDAGRAPDISMVHFSVQHQLPGRVMADFLYFGQFAHGIIASGPEERNQINYEQYGSLGSLLTADVYSPAAVAAGIKVPYPGFEGSVAQALRPFPQYLSIQNEGAGISWSTYNSFQFKAQKQFSNGLGFLVGYTISKALSDVSTNVPGYFAVAAQDAYNHRVEKALSNIDIPQSLIFNYTYELPFGTGKKYLNHGDPVSRYVLGGWTISGVQTYNSGMPLAIATEISLPTMSSGALSPAVLRPDIVPGVGMVSHSCSGFDPATDRQLNINAFAAPPPWTFGNAPRTLPNVRSCGYFNENISLFKNVPLKERANLQVGVDTFNLFNRHPWGGPDTDINSAGFGQISSVNPGRIVQVRARIDF